MCTNGLLLLKGLIILNLEKHSFLFFDLNQYKKINLRVNYENRNDFTVANFTLNSEKSTPHLSLFFSLGGPKISFMYRVHIERNIHY